MACGLRDCLVSSSCLGLRSQNRNPQTQSLDTSLWSLLSPWQSNQSDDFYAISILTILPNLHLQAKRLPKLQHLQLVM